MDVKIINKYRAKSTKDLIPTAANWFNKFIRLRDCDDYGNATCISSGNPIKYGKQLQAGHFFPGGPNPGLKFNEDNVHSQSLQDNYYKHSNALEYRKNLVRKIGAERVEKLEELAAYYKRTGYSWDRFKLIEIIEEYKVKVQKEITNKMFEVK